VVSFGSNVLVFTALRARRWKQNGETPRMKWVNAIDPLGSEPSSLICGP
jgi:hypothetical protein